MAVKALPATSVGPVPPGRLSSLKGASSAGSQAGALATFSLPWSWLVTQTVFCCCFWGLEPLPEEGRSRETDTPEAWAPPGRSPLGPLP